MTFKAKVGGDASVFCHLSPQLQRPVFRTLLFLQVHQPLPKSPLQLQDATTTSLTVIVIDNLVECHTTNGQLADFKCRRNALGDDRSLFVSGLIFLYRIYVS